MRVARLHAPGDLRIEEAPVPDAGPGELTMRVRSCSTCGTDAKIFHHGHHHISLPRVLGHEVAGEFAQVGSEVDGWTAGDRIQVIAAIPCGVCHYCRRGQETVCEDLESIGYQYDGGFAEFDGPVERLPVAFSSAEWYGGKIEHLAMASIQSEGGAR